jgi:hypothetical protein
MAIEFLAEFYSFISNHIKRYENLGKGYTSYISSSTYEEIIHIMSKKVQSTDYSINKCFTLFLH